MDSAGVLPLKTVADFTDIGSTSSVMVNRYTPRDRLANTLNKKRITASDMPLEDLVFDIQALAKLRTYTVATGATEVT